MEVAFAENKVALRRDPMKRVDRGCKAEREEGGSRAEEQGCGSLRYKLSEVKWQLSKFPPRRATVSDNATFHSQSSSIPFVKADSGGPTCGPGVGSFVFGDASVPSLISSCSPEIGGWSKLLLASSLTA